MTIKWADAPSDDDKLDAKKFLSLYSLTSVTLGSAGIYYAKDLLRAAGLPGLPKENLGVQKYLKKYKAGEAVSPVLVVPGALGRNLIIAEGYHRVSSCYLLDEKTEVHVYFLDAAYGMTAVATVTRSPQI